MDHRRTSLSTLSLTLDRDPAVWTLVLDGVQEAAPEENWLDSPGDDDDVDDEEMLRGGMLVVEVADSTLGLGDCCCQTGVECKKLIVDCSLELLNIE